jgi:SAM-dependent methyltransferase
MVYEGHDQLLAMREARNYNRMLEHLLQKWLWPYPTLLDIGAGLGDFALRMQENHGHEVIALEPDAAQRDAMERLGLSTVESVEALHEPVDAAYSLNVLEHIEDDVGAVTEWAGCIRNGGLLVIYVPAFMVLYSAMDQAVGHCRRYTREQLALVVMKAGMTVVQSGYADSLGFPASLAMRLRSRNWKGDLKPEQVRFYDRVVFPVSRMLDLVASPFFGKNVWVVARKSTTSPRRVRIFL